MNECLVFCLKRILFVCLRVVMTKSTHTLKYTTHTNTFTLRFFYCRFCFRSVHSWHTYLLCLCVNVYWADRFMHSCHRIVFARNTRRACRNVKRSRHKNVLLEHLYCTNLGIDRNQNIGNESYFRVIAANCWHIRPIYAWIVYVIHDTVTVMCSPFPKFNRIYNKLFLICCFPSHIEWCLPR